MRANPSSENQKGSSIFANEQAIFSSVETVESLQKPQLEEFVTKMAAEGGSGVYEKTKRILLHLANDSIWQEFNRFDTHEKRKFPADLE